MTKSKAYTCRMDDANSELIEEATRTSGFNRAQILRRAFQHYVATNPDEIMAFQETYTESSIKKEDKRKPRDRLDLKASAGYSKKTKKKTVSSWSEMGILSSIYDPTQEAF